MTDTPGIRQNFQSNEKLTMWSSYLLVALMMACVAAAVVQLAHRLAPDWPGEFLPFLAFLVSVEAMYTSRMTRRLTELVTQDLVYRVIELIVIAFLIKLFLYALYGFDRLIADLPLWQENFFVNFFTAEFVFVCFIALVVWYLSGWFAQALLDLEGDDLLLAGPDLDGVISNRGQIKQNLASGVFTIGFVLVLVTSLVHIDFQAIWGSRPLPRWGVFNVLLYFIFSLALLSLSHFSARRAGWAWERIPISSNLGRHWLIYSLILMAAVAAVAFILPTRYTLGFLETLNYLLNLVLAAFYFLFFLVSAPVLFLIGLILSLIRGDSGESPPQTVTPEFQLPEAPVQDAAPIPWLNVLRSVLFWGLFVAVLLYAFTQYTRQNQGLLKELRRLPGWKWLAGAWHTFWTRLRGWNSKVGSVIQTGLRRVLGRAGAARRSVGQGGFVSLRRLTTRQRVLFFYLSLVRQGEEKGYPRGPSQTPSEYAQSLSRSLPPGPQPDPAVEDLNNLTDAFVEARYSQHEISIERADIVRRLWNRTRRALKGKRSGGETSERD